MKGWIVKHKTDVCSGPGVTREGLRALRLPQSARARLHPEAEQLQWQAAHQHGDSSVADPPEQQLSLQAVGPKTKGF